MSKKIFVLFVILMILASPSSIAVADKPVQVDASGNELAWSHSGCPDIQSGTITDSAGNPITTGYDQYGYNYQAHMFNGTYDGSDRNLDGTYWGQSGDFVDDHLIMKWSDEWLANVDCNGDHKLDRGLVNGVPSGVSYGWLTNHVEGDYVGADGNVHNYTDFVKIIWTGPGGDLWGQYTIIEEVYNDPYGGSTGLLDKLNPGLGHEFSP